MNFLRKAAKFGPDILWRILSVVAIFLLILSVAGSAVMTEWSGYINKTLGIQDTAIVETGDGEQDPVHFKSEFETYQETMENARAVAKQAQAEGTVLMTNENGALPLEKGANVTFFSYSSIDVALGGTGSGGVTAPEDRKFDIPRACEEDGKLNYNETMYAFYEGKFDEGYMVTPESANPWTGELVPATMTRKDGSTFVVPEVPASDFTTEVRESWNEYGDADKAVLSNKADFDETEYSLSATTQKVTNLFEEADINYLGGTSDEVVYLSRSDWSGTWPQTVENFSATSEMIDDMDALYDGTNTGAANKPAAYEKGSSDISGIDISETTLETQGQYSIAMMIGVAYDDPAWEELLSQLSIDDLAKFTKQGREAIPSVGLNATTAVDGPAAWTKSHYKEDYDDFSADAAYTDEVMVSYPTETVLAGTWNVELLYEIGVSFGEEGLWGGGVGWYGPAANTHRTPYAGRNFEYYSEDGFLAGKLGEQEVHGAMSKGTIPYYKHFFLNDQETNRIGVCTFSNEQAIREIYLRAFQYAFETTGEGDPSCSGVMGGFNRLGVTWTGHYTKLWKEVMDGEWGFTGNVTTDFGQNPTGLMEPQLAYEAGTNMFCTSGNTFYSLVVVQAQTDAKLLTNMRESAHRILYNFANSAAMNGLTSTTRVVPIMTWYEIALLTMTIASAVVLVAAGAMTLVHTFAKKEEN